MQCSLAKKLLGDYSRGRLDEEHVLVLETHLGKCYSCSKVLRKLNLKRNLLKWTVAISTIIAVLFVVVQSTHKADISLDKPEEGKKVVSNIIIEVLSKNVESDSKVLRLFIAESGVKIVGEKPLSVKLKKAIVDQFVENLDRVLILPEDVRGRIREFIKPLDNGAEVIIKIKFLEKSGKTG